MKRVGVAVVMAIGMAACAAQAPSTGGGTLVGGGLGAVLTGGGDDARVAYGLAGAGGGAGWSQVGLASRFAGSHGDGPQVEYTAPATVRDGQEAWLLGGGDDAGVVYGRPR
jgi:hypothetical protein